MMYFSRARILSILGVCLLGVLLCLPNLVAAPAAWLPWRQVHLGLDLRGGSYLLMQVDMATVLRERLDGLADAARQALVHAPGGVIGYQNLGAQPAAPGTAGATGAGADQPNRVTLRLRDPAQRDAALAALRAIPPAVPDEFTVDALPDGRLAITLSQAALRARAEAAVGQSIEIVRRRIDETGVLDPQITRQGEDRIIVELPGIDDPNHIRDLLGQTAKMSFHMVDPQANPASPPPGEMALSQTTQPGQIVVTRQADLDGADLTNAQPGQNPQSGEWVVNFTLNGLGSRRFADITRTHIGQPFAIVLDNKVISAPVIQGVIPGGQGQISGRFNAQSATDLSVLLRAGALPAPLSVVEQRSIGPELGADSIRAGALSLGVGFLLVIGFMGTFYGLFGWLANLALLANLVLMLAILSLFQATLTLPGMAGILLTLGMAVDANILINERIREEARAGRAPVAAMEAGFRRAYSTIIDSNATALLAHVMLFVFGTGPVRGFALTITIGIVTTLFTATVVARMLMVRWYARTRPSLLPV